METAIDSLVFLITLRCPLACPHCIVNSSPRRTEELDADLVLRLIDEAAAAGVRTVGFTGGEPFVRPKELRRFFDKASSYGMRTIVITSAFFARSMDQAVRVLEPYAELDMLGISTDVYHQQFTELGRVRYAIRAAKHLGMRRIEVQVAFLEEGAIDKVRVELGADGDGVVIRGQVVWPVGRATQLLPGFEAALVPVEQLDLRCPMVGPVVTPDGKVHACCSALLDLKEKDPLILGDVTHDDLHDVMERADSDIYYNFLKKFGLLPIVKMIQKSPCSGVIKPGYTDVCHLCHDIHSNPQSRELVLNKFR